MAVKKILLLLLLISPASAFLNYTTRDYNGTSINTTQEFEQFRTGEWLLGSWTFWINLLVGNLQYLPVAIIVILLGFVGYVKSGTVIVPAIWFLFFSTVVGITLWIGLAPYLGYIVLGVLLAAIIVAFMKVFYG